MFEYMDFILMMNTFFIFQTLTVTVLSRHIAVFKFIIQLRDKKNPKQEIGQKKMNE